MDSNLTFKDFEKINDALVQVEQLVFEYSKKLSESKNYADLEVVAKLKIKLDEVENIIVDECRARREKVNLFEQPMTLEEQLANRKLDDIEVVMLDGRTKEQAETFLNWGCMVLDGEDFEENFDDYMKQWNIAEDEQIKYLNMIKNKKTIKDFSIVEKYGKTYYIRYCMEI